MSSTDSSGKSSRSRITALTVAAIGVVYGDIGTSPLYAIKECFSPHYGLDTGMREVFGILSLIFWALTLVVSVKYLAVIMRFDHKGEGGEMALMSLVLPFAKSRRVIFAVTALGLFGATLMYGDGVITPAISVLSAVEGLTVAAPDLSRFVIPITLVILFGLFVIQRRGTGSVGRIFGPVTISWFILMGIMGIASIIQSPEVLVAMNPWYALDYFMHHGISGLVVLGSVFLVVTGGETVYADMGHFGKGPIRYGWFILVFPCLLLNYFGQGALLLREGHVASTVANPFFHMVPSWGVIPLVIFSTFATMIASQAVISGAFSLTWQALQLGNLPRLKVMHTSMTERGQIYIPFINWALFTVTVFLVLQFRSSGNLAAMYGIAVSTTMVITSLIAWHAMRQIANWSVGVSLVLTVIFLVVDFAFWGANALKIPEGGWVPLVLGGLIFLIIMTWRTGRRLLREAIERRTPPLAQVIEDIDKYETVPGTAIYMNGYAGTAPPALVNNVRYNRCRHETIILLTVQVQKRPHVDVDERFEVEVLPKNFYQVVLRYGFMDQPELMQDLLYLPEFDIPVDITDATFILGHESISIREEGGMATWRKHLFSFLHRNSRTPVKYFGVPFKRVLEVGSNVEI
ncbi:MAG: potassium transporter Kup [Ignavibacteriae bacterium]|nr:MAG: potassium transporter Kup [Ignavibacteriota bacterium]